MKVIGYIRVSTDGQEQSGLGLEDQEAKVRAYCSLYDLELVAIHRDAASGKIDQVLSGAGTMLHPAWTSLPIHPIIEPPKTEPAKTKVEKKQRR